MKFQVSKLFYYVQHYPISYSMNSKYTIVDDTMRFDFNFNEPLTNYYHVIVQYSKVIFFNIFNYPIVLTPNLTYAKFGNAFSHFLVLSKNMTGLSLGNVYNKPIVFSKMMTHITLGSKFNQPLYLNKNMRHLTLKSIIYAQPIFLTKHVTHLSCKENYKSFKPLVLPKNLIFLAIGFNYKQSIILTKNITHLSLSPQNDSKIYFKDSIDCLEITSNNTFVIDNIPNDTTLIKLYGIQSNNFNNLPNRIEKIDDYRFTYNQKT